MKQYLKLKLNQKLSPQQIQLMKLIQLPTIDFEQKIKQELEENPALEIKDNSNDALDEEFSNSNEDELNNESIDDEDINIEDYINYDDTPAYKLSYNTNNDSENNEIPLASGISFTEYLLNQLNTLRLNDDEAPKIEAMKAAEGILIEGFEQEGRTFGKAWVFKCSLKNGEKNVKNCAIISPKRTHYRRVVEVISPVFLRDELKAKDGDTFTINVDLGDI